MKRLLYIVCLLLATATITAREYGDSAVYQGFNIKLDIGNTAYTLLRSKAATQQYEMAFNVNILKRFYPTIEGGYGWSADEAAGGSYQGHGGFMRIGMDLNPLKKNRSSEYALLVGLRLGLGLQDFSLTGVNLNDNYWNPDGIIKDYPATVRADCWGEILAGMQVKVYGPLSMGWYARIHTLFTSKTGDHQPYWIPGYGNIDGAIFSFNYYIGLRF